MANDALFVGVNGTKTLSLNNPHLWENVLGFEDMNNSEINAEKAYSAVGWVNRCVHIRAASLSSMPWGVYSGDTEILAHDYDDFTGYEWAESLRTMLYLTESAMCLLGHAYWFKNRTRGAKLESLRWWAASTVEPVYDSAAPDGIRAFKRRVGQTTQTIDRDNVVYFKLPNPTHETLPGVSPVEAALADAGVLYNVAKFASAFFRRGAIKATILTIEGTAQQAERERLKSWWENFMTGVRNAWGSSVVNAAVKPVIVGEGIGELSNVALTDEKRQGISTTLGIPHSLVMSNAANFATSQQDELNFYNLTVIPESRLLETQLNRQLFRPLGLRFQWKTQEMALFQEDEEQRAQSLLNYTNAGMPLHIAAEILGINLPEGMEYADLGAMLAEQQAQRDEMARLMAQRTQPQPMAEQPHDHGGDGMDDSQRIEARTFRRWLRRNPGKNAGEFVANHLTDAQKSAIVDEVSADTDFFTPTMPDIWTGDNIPDAAESVAAWKALILQMDDGDDEAERRAREAIERAAAEDIADALERQRRILLPANVTPTSADDVARRVSETSGSVRDALRRMLIESADLGVSVAVAQFDTIGYGFDWTLANVAARDWANRHAGELITLINDTTRNQVRQAVAAWIENGDPLPALIRELAPMFGGERAKLIAATEVTNAYAEANRLSYIESGVVDEIEWRTARDERVCPICGPLHGRRTSVENPDFDGRGIPSAHPRCRCWIVPVIED